MDKNHVGRGSSQVSLRMPLAMRTRIKEIAKENRRSINSELLSLVEWAIKLKDGKQNVSQ